MRQQEIAVLAGELLHPLVGCGIVVERLHLLLLALGRVAHQYVGGLPRVLFIFPTDHLQAHAKPILFSRSCARAIALISALLAAIRSGRSPQNRCTSECFADIAQASREPPPR